MLLEEPKFFFIHITSLRALRLIGSSTFRFFARRIHRFPRMKRWAAIDVGMVTKGATLTVFISPVYRPHQHRWDDLRGSEPLLRMHHGAH